MPRINANGSQMHTNYQLDGNTNTEKDRAGLRLLPVSEVLVREVKVVTNGFAPEFGQTTGMVYNAITPSGTNDLHGSASFRFKRNPFSTEPFFLAAAARASPTPRPTTSPPRSAARSRRTAALLRRVRVRRSQPGHRRTGHHRDAGQRRGARHHAAVRAASSPRTRRSTSLFGKTDYQFSPANRSRSATSCSRTSPPSNIGGGLDDDRSRDRLHRSHGLGVGAAGLDARLEHAERAARAVRAAASVPHAGHLGRRSGDHRVGRRRVRRRAARRRQLDRLRLQAGHHPGHRQPELDSRHARASKPASTRSSSPTTASGAICSSIPSRRSRRTSRRRAARIRSATPSLQQLFGNTGGRLQLGLLRAVRRRTTGRSTPQMKVLYGLRYDLFDVPSARPFAANPYSQDFTIDKNNFGPRAGVSWAVDSSARTVLRASTGLMYEPPLLDFYDNAILNNGDPASFTVSVAGHQRGRAAVPGQPGERAGRLRPAAAEHHRGRSRLQDAVGVAEQRADRARAQQRPRRLGRLRQLDRPQPAGADRRQPDPDGRDAARRPADLLDRGQRGDARRSDLQPGQHVPVDRRVDLQRVHRDDDQADDARVAGAGDLHAGARRGQRAAHRHLRRRQRRRPRVGSVEPRSRQGRDAVQPDAHVLAVRR